MPNLRDLLGARIPLGEEFLIVIAPRCKEERRHAIAGYLIRTDEAFIVRELDTGEMFTRPNGALVRYTDYIAEIAETASGNDVYPTMGGNGREGGGTESKD